MKKAILITDAICNGSGSDRFKTVSGITREVLKKVADLAGEQNSAKIYDRVVLSDTFGPDKIELLANSNTNYQGQKYKRVINIGKRYTTHRQINDADYEIIATI